MVNVVELAWQIIDMQRTIDRQEEELEVLREYKKDYNDLLNSSISHGQHMVRGMLDIAMTPGVMSAIDKHNSQQEIHHVLEKK